MLQYQILQNSTNKHSAGFCLTFTRILIKKLQIFKENTLKSYNAFIILLHIISYPELKRNLFVHYLIYLKYVMKPSSFNKFVDKTTLHCYPGGCNV